MFQIVPFRTAATGLENCTSFSPDTARATLRRIVAISDLARIFRELKKPMPRINIPISYKNGVDLTEVEENILNLLGRLFPIDEEIMLNNQMEDDGLFNENGDCVIVPAFIGWETNWDEIAEAIDDGPMYSDGMSIHIFIHAYSNGFEKDQWDIFNKYFNWRVECPNVPQGYLNLPKLYKIIDQSKEIKFDSSFIQANCMDTGLPFFDFNPYEDDGYDAPDFRWSYENIMQLAEQWKQAKVIVDRIPYNFKVSRDPNQLKLLIKAMKESQRR